MIKTIIIIIKKSHSNSNTLFFPFLTQHKLNLYYIDEEKREEEEGKFKKYIGNCRSTS